MRYQSLLKIFTFGVFTFVLAGCNGSFDVKTDAQKASYAVGQNIGRNIKGQAIAWDMPALCGGISDSVQDRASRISDDEIKKAMGFLQESAMKKNQEEAEKNKKEGDAYLAANKAKEGWKVTASGLQYKVVKEGAGATPKDGDIVIVQYTGTTIDGKKFDSSLDRGQPAELPVNGVIPGWTEALKLMKVGEQMQLAIPSDLAYRQQGNPKFGPNSTLLFDLTLMGIKEAAPAPAAGKGAKSKKH